MPLLEFKLDNREFICNFWEEERKYFSPKNRHQYCSGLDSRWDSGESWSCGKTMGNLCSIRNLNNKYMICFLHDLHFLNNMFLNPINNQFKTCKEAQEQAIYIIKRYLNLQAFL